jgi:hypothetical protein
MEDQELFNQIKVAANNDAMQHFGAMDKVWNRVEAKLDNKILKKENTVWKKLAVAASLLLVGTLGYQFFKNDKITIKPNQILTQKDSIKNIFSKKDVVVSADNQGISEKSEAKTNPAIKKEADAILEKQLKPRHQVAMEEVKRQSDRETESDAISNTQLGYFNAPITSNTNNFSGNSSYESTQIQPKGIAVSKDVELFLKKENSIFNEKKEQPLLVFDDKVANKQTVKSVKADEVESLVELKEPLYIINGVEYTEQEVFGPNPTSPYTPLNQQEIETISILQDEKAIETYGEKGRKGVVIITTKYGKPVAKKRQ